MSAPKKPPKPTLYLCGLPLSFEAAKALRELPKLESLDAVLPVVVADLAGAPPDGEAYRAMQRALSLDADAAAALFTGLHWVVRACMRSNLKAKALAAELFSPRSPRRASARARWREWDGTRRAARARRAALAPGRCSRRAAPERAAQAQMKACL